MALNITNEVLRAMANLNANNEPNWLTIKKWLQGEATLTQRLAAFGVDITIEKVRVFQGMAFILNDMSFYAENAKEHLEKTLALENARHAKKQPAEGTS